MSADPRTSRGKLLTTEEVAAASGCLHRWYLECHGNPDDRRPSAPDPADDAFRRQCISWVADLEEPSWNGRDTERGHRNTVRLMEEGHAWIYGGVLMGQGMLGRPDLLKRVDVRSALGSHSYVPAKVKRHPGRVETADVHELQLHALLLEPVLRQLPAAGWVYRPDGLSVEVDLRSSWASFTTLIDDLRRISRGGLLTEGYRCAACPRCPWADHCRQVWTQLSHVCLLPGLNRSHVGAFREGGYASWSSIAASTPERLALHVGLPTSRARLLWLHAKAFQSGRPLVIQTAPFPQGIPVHFYVPEFHDGRCGLHGDLRMMNGEPRLRQFLAAAPAQEGAAWRAFLDDLARDERALVFSWTDRVTRPLEILWKRHGGNPAGWRLLNRGRRSLHRFLRQQVILPLSEYTLRDVASFFSFKWSTRQEPGSPFPAPWERERGFPELEASHALLEANRERIDAMKQVYLALQRLQELGWSATA